MRVFALGLVVGCSYASAIGVDASAPDVDAGADAAPPAGCVDVDDVTAVPVATAGTADDYALTLTAKTASATSWGEAGNEGVVLEVRGTMRGFIGHLVLHQGKATFDYGMAIGALAPGEQVTASVSTLSAPSAARKACVAGKLVAASELGDAADGLVHAPIYRWPIQKAFDDLPMLAGWSKTKQSFQTVFTNEDGGTVVQCGGGPGGIQAEIARWGRAADIEGDYDYTSTPSWERCTGTTTTALRMEGDHPILYYGDGHNRLFESRAGYGQTCGSDGPEKANGDLDGWNVGNTDDSLAGDDGHVIVVRPLPVALDAIDYATFSGRREGLIDSYAPWLYRITSLELAKEAKIDDAKSLAMSRYLYADVRVADVGGSGDEYCATLGVSGGFRLRAFTVAGVQIDGPQITADYASSGAYDWKRVAIALPAGIAATDIDHFMFDAYDGDGIYLTALGDAFVAEPDGGNGAKLDYVRHGTTTYADYVDDDSSGCAAGVNSGGPGGSAYQCVGGQVSIPK